LVKRSQDVHALSAYQVKLLRADRMHRIIVSIVAASCLVDAGYCHAKVTQVSGFTAILEGRTKRPPDT
jgi:hypothetical protein